MGINPTQSMIILNVNSLNTLIKKNKKYKKVARVA